MPRRLPSAVWKFAISGLAVLVLIVGAGVFILDRIAEGDAIDNAAEITQLAAHGAVEPNLTDDVAERRSRRPRAARQAGKTRVLSASVVRVKVWTPDGRIVYSDEPRLIGEQFALPADAQARSSARAASTPAWPTCRVPENQLDRDNGKLLEVYTAVKHAVGTAAAVRAVPRLLVGHVRARVRPGGRSAWPRSPVSSPCGWSSCRWRSASPGACAAARRIASSC